MVSIAHPFFIIPPYSSIFLHIPSYSFIFLHIPSLFLHIILHIPSYSFIFLHIPSLFLHIPPYSSIFLHYSSIFLHIPPYYTSYSFIFLHIPSYSFIFLHYPSLFLHIPSYSFIFLHIPSFVGQDFFISPAYFHALDDPNRTTQLEAPPLLGGYSWISTAPKAGYVEVHLRKVCVASSCAIWRTILLWIVTSILHNTVTLMISILL